MLKRYDLWIGGKWRQAEQYEMLYAPYNGEELALIAQATPAEAEEAIVEAHAAYESYKRMPASQRSRILFRVAEAIEARREELAGIIAREAAKPMTAARAEIARTVETYRFSAEAAKNITGEQVAMDAAEGGQGKIGFTVRTPIGVVTAITPFNFPFNLVAHKVGPALAAGNAVVVKPAEQTPISALVLAELFAEAGLPAGVLAIVTGKGAELGEKLSSHPLVKKVSFTGSHAVGELIQRHAGLRRTTLELGSNSALIIDEGTNIDDILARCVAGAYAYNGQVCISLQRILVHRSLYEDFAARFAQAAKQLSVGAPLDDKTELTSLISEKAAHRVAAWVEEAAASGASVVAGGRMVEGEGNHIFAATVLTDVPRSAKVWSEEIFGPVAVIMPFDELEEAVRAINESRYGLQAGIYTANIHHAMAAALELEAGGVVINDIPTFRTDQMPYGGVKDSGKGTEGVAYAVEEMTQLKLIAIHLRK